MNQDVKRFFDAAPKDRKPLVMELHELILSMYPEAEPVLWYCMPTCRANKGWVAVGYWKGGVTVYSESFECVAAFKAANPGCNTGKGSIQFKAGEPLPTATLKEFIRCVISGSRARRRARGD